MRVATTRLPSWPSPLVVPAHPVRLGQVVAVTSAALSAARTGQGFASGSLGFESTGQSISTAGALVSTTGAIAALLPTLIAIPYVGWIAAAIGAILSFAGGLFGKPQLSHEQREQLEVQKVGGIVQQMIGQIQQAGSLQALWDTLVHWNSGYVGGSSDVAVPVFLDDDPPPVPHEGTPGEEVATGAKAQMQAEVARGDILLPAGQTDLTAALLKGTGGGGWAATHRIVFVGTPNAIYLTWTRDGFFRALLANPERVLVDTQAGITPAKLRPINVAVRNAILNQLNLFQRAGATTPTAPAPDPSAVSNFIRQSYQQLLGRLPAAAEEQAALGPLVARQVTPEQFVQAITDSAEFKVRAAGPDPATVSAWVRQVYQQLLQRLPTSSEEQAAVSALLARQISPEQFVQAITRAPEFRAVAPAAVTLAPPAAAAPPLVQPLFAAAVTPTVGLGPWITLGAGAAAVALIASSSPKRRGRR